MRMPAALLLLFCAGPAAAGVTAPALVALRGNVLFDELVYRSTLDLPESARATPTEALAVSAKLLGFLRRAGYDLATVRAKVEGEHIAVDIDEGKLDKIVVFGEGIMETFRFKLELSMPAGVFNRPTLERQLRVLADRYRLRHYSYQLVPAAVQESCTSSSRPARGRGGSRPRSRSARPKASEPAGSTASRTSGCPTTVGSFAPGWRARSASISTRTRRDRC